MKKQLTFRTIIQILCLLTLITLTSQVSTIDNLGSGTLKINIQTYYTWTITLQQTITSINLTFPTQCSLSTNTSAQLVSPATTLNASYLGSTLIITNATLSGQITINVSRVMNPNSAITTHSFSFQTINEIISLAQGNQFIYDPGSLSDASWAFSECTEQPHSVLTSTVTISSSIPASSSNKFIIKYDSWSNLPSKNILTDVTTSTQLKANVTYNGSTVSAIIVFDKNSNKITVTYSQSVLLVNGDKIVVVVDGVQSPPTRLTPSSNYWVATADSNGFIFDQSSTLTIQPTCIYTLSTGLYIPTSPVISSLSYGPTIQFAEKPTITFKDGDKVEMYFSPLSNFNGCTYLKIWRNIDQTMQASTPILASSYIEFTIGAQNTPNTDTIFNITLKLTCISVTITKSETPVDLTFKFKRNNTYYLQLGTQMKPSAATLPTTKATVTPSRYQVTYSGVDYTFNILTSYLLGASPALAITVPPQIGVPNSVPSCSVKLNTSTSTTGPSCLFNSSTISVNFTSSLNAQIPVGTTITVVVQGISNAAEPKTYYMGVATYFSSLDSTSKVQQNSLAFDLTFVGMSNYPMTFSPSSLQVYNVTTTTISITPNISIPTGSTILVQYPSEIDALTTANYPLQINNITSSSARTIHINDSYSVVTGEDISPNQELILTATITAPSAMNTYNFVQVFITYNNIIYLSSTTTMSLEVNSVNSISPILTPSPSKAAATASYTIDLPMTVPHPEYFYLSVYLPSDVSYTSTGSSCSGACNSTVLSSNSSYFRVNVTNPSPNVTGHLLSVTLTATFTNPRAIGNGMLWNLSTSTIAQQNAITFSQAYPVIDSANTLIAQFLSDSYFKGSTEEVKFFFTFFRKPEEGDIIRLQMDTDTYDQTSAGSLICSGAFGNCSKNINSTSSLLIVDIDPNVAAMTNNTLSMVLEGVTSGNNVAESIPVKLLNGSGNLAQEGFLNYALSCRDGTTDSILNNCKTCYQNYSCQSCYTEQGFYLNSSLVCVTNCGLATNYYYNDNTTYTCASCSNGCYTCSSEDVCITCISNYYFYQHNSSCKSTCDPNGFIQLTGTTELICVQCYGGGLCLQCNSSVVGSCTLCVSGTVLTEGQCLSSCSDATMYPSGGKCYPCHQSCLTCFAATSAGCYSCASGYYNYSGDCLSACPSGTAANSDKVCTCDSPCSRCEGTTTFCTGCINSSLFVSNGQCLSSCPGETYLSGTTCVNCNTACSNCSATTCYSCHSGNYLYNNICYSDCNLISQQYDVSGTTCVLCPNGCDTCSGTTCSSCLADYSLSSSSSQCIKTCLLTNSCDIEGEQVLPLPGLIAVAVWVGIVVVIKLILHKNYLPYSMVLFSAVVELVLACAVISSAPNLVDYSRLLLPSDSERTTIRALLAVYIATNYLSNIVYIVVFVKYIKPLLVNPRQIDTISNVVVIVIGTLTNYRFALIAYAKLFPKPFIHVSNSSKLTPVHYLCVASILLDVFAISACSVALYNEQPKTDLFMLALDLLVVVVLNVVLTIWFVGCAKSDEYYQDDIKKYHLEDAHGTNETMPNEKDLSKGKIVANDTCHFTDEESSSYKVDALNASYNKLNLNQSKVSIQSIRETRGQNRQTDDSGEDSHIVPVRARNQASKDNAEYDPFSDPNYEVGLKPKYSGRHPQVVPTRDQERANANNSETRSADQGLDLKHRSSPKNYTKHRIVDDYINEDGNGVAEVEEEDYDLPDLGEESQNEGRKSVFELPREKIARPRRTGTDRKVRQNSTLVKSSEEPLKIGNMKKAKRIGYFQSDALESNEDDIESIIKQKVWQSSIRKKEGEERKEFESSNSEVGNEEISPSWFNIQNQRVELSDFDERESGAAEPEP